MEFKKTKLKGVRLIKPQVFGDQRGFFMEAYSKKKFQEAGIETEFVQDNHSKSEKKGVLRGLHFQNPPYDQAKLVRVVKGAVFDVIVDLRKNSPTFGKWEGFELSEKNFLMLYVPKGFAHGFCALQPETEFLYKVDNFYHPESENGIIWNDPVLAVDWPVEKPILSEKDQKMTTFEEIENPF
jgi:dTDP-4-dehydrorhamnose 3,5-epimerase